MTVIDTTFLLHHLVGRSLEGYLLEHELDPTGIQVLSSTICEAIEGLVEMDFSRKEAAKAIIDAISLLSIEDATVHLYACFVYGESRFSYADCLSFAYARLDGVTPTFSNTALAKAYKAGKYRFDA